jgi:tetratricopeptide (TPR) repeat protein
MIAWVLAAALALPAPAAVAPDAAQQAQVMVLPPALQAQLHREVLVGHPSQTVRLQRLIPFALDPQGLGVIYEESATYSVEQVYATRKANCLAFTLLFLALAREAGLDAYPQELGETLSWHESGGTIFRDNHINAGIRIGGHRYTVDVAGDSVFGLQPPAQVSDERMLAHYYNNLAVMRLEHGDITIAQQYMATALALDPGYAPHWSNAGVLALHGGDPVAAERDYLKALALDPGNASALFNMVDLAHRSGDRRREAEFRERLARVQQNDPLQHFVQALDFERLGDYPHAIEHYLRAIQLHHGEHRFYSALARAYLLAGDNRRASRALARAESLSDGATRAAYRAQRDGLQAAN